jgi:hypothetical protein
VKAFNEASLEVRLAVNPQLPLELAVVSALAAEQPAVPVAAASSVRPAPAPRPAAVPSTPSSSGVQYVRPEPEPMPAVAEPVSSEPGPVSGRELTLESVGAQWSAILTEVQSLNRTASSLLGHATLLAVGEGQVTIGFESEPLRDLFVKDPKKGEYLQAAVLKVLGQKIGVKCTVKPKGPSRDDSDRGAAESTQAKTTEMPRAVADKPREQAASSISPTPKAMSGELPASNQAIDSYPASDPASDRVVREAVERFGAKISGVQRLSNGREK